MNYFFGGAFGTYYNTFSDGIAELANLHNKEKVIEIHKDYIDAGAEFILTNSYNCNSNIMPYEKIRETIESSFDLAFEATKNTNVKIVASIGQIDREDNFDEYTMIVDAFLDKGARYFIFESFSNYDCVKDVFNYIKSKNKNTFIIFSITPTQDGYTSEGHYFTDLLYEADKNPNINVVGLNCTTGPTKMISFVKELNVEIRSKLLIMPNANYPVMIDHKPIFENNADYFSDKMVVLSKLGVKYLGGCCGTTPEHIRKSREKIFAIKIEEIQESKKKKQKVVRKQHNIFETNKKIISVEVDSPKNTDFDKCLRITQQLKEKKIDLITVADSPLARTHMDSMISAIKLKRDAHVNVIPHLNCRDKNTIAIKAGLLGLVSEGINDVMVITGDPIVSTNSSKGVFEMSALNMISYIHSLNEQVFQENKINICGALNVNARVFKSELNKAKRKIENGAIGLFTQPIYEKRAIENLKLAKETLDCKILAGILPVASYGNGMFLNNEVSGINIPDSVLATLNTDDKELARKNTIEYSKIIIDEVYDIADGFYIMLPLKKVDLVLELVDYIKSKESGING